MAAEGSPGERRHLLVAVAAPREAEAVLAGLRSSARAGALARWAATPVRPGVDLVLTGVGKANAAGAVAAAATPAHRAVLSIGLAGALPGSALSPGSTMCATWCAFADEGRFGAEGFRSLAAMGFPSHEIHGDRFEADVRWSAGLTARTDAAGGCATVSTCSATDALAAEIARRTGALAEDMESAAVALAAARLGLPFACVRVISNQTGDRQGWRLEEALSALGVAAARVCDD